MRNHSYSSEDRDYLIELIRYFPVLVPPTINQAQQKIQDRCQSWNPSEFVEKFIELFDSDTFVDILPSLPIELHEMIFDGILSNAGCYRDKSDAYTEGHVEFGLPVRRLSCEADSSNGKFTGVKPELIEREVEKAFKCLEKGPQDPLVNAATFYQQFIRAHPFYDANGRIGRFIVDAYLYSHNMYIDWEKLKNTTRWIRQLNYCHRKIYVEEYNKRPYKKALKYWIQYLRKFVHVVNEGE